VDETHTCSFDGSFGHTKLATHRNSDICNDGDTTRRASNTPSFALSFPRFSPESENLPKTENDKKDHSQSRRSEDALEVNSDDTSESFNGCTVGKKPILNGVSVLPVIPIIGRRLANATSFGDLEISLPIDEVSCSVAGCHPRQSRAYVEGV